MQSLRLKKLPTYLFAEIDRKKRELKAKGIDLIDLSIGDPDLPTPKHIVEEFKRAASDVKNHRYPPYSGLPEFREAACEYLQTIRGVSLDPESEVLALIGSKEGIAHAPAAFVNEDEIVLVPSPGYPVYSSAPALFGIEHYEIPLLKKNDFLPELDAIPENVLKKARLLFLNYPNNPTSATAPMSFFETAVAFAKKHDLIICHDAAYLEITYDGYKAPSILEVKGARDVAIEFHSLSKTFNMTGWRLGFAAGNKDLIASLGKIKTLYDSSATAAVQKAGAFALASDPECIGETCAVYKRRRDRFMEAILKKGWKANSPKATFYVWVEVPSGATSADFATMLMERSGIVATPGNGFGSYGEGYIRFSLTAPDDRIDKAIQRLEKHL